MTDTSGTPSQTGLAPRAGGLTTAFVQVFGDVRPYAPPRELPLSDLESVPGRSRLLVQLLHNRGITGADAIAAFLGGDWHARGPALLNLDRAAERIQHAIRGGEHIVVFGDFDCDGITSCALLTVALRSLGAHVTPYVPRRDDDGRGLNSEAVRQLADMGARLIVTTDCGTANVAEVELSRSYGVDVIITDHHPPHGPLAPAYALVNPWQDGDESPENDLAGVGVAFRLAEALLADSPSGADLLDGLLELVAIGTIADVVSLTPPNWALVRAGLRQINTSPRAGVRALLNMARLTAGNIMARDISFALAPRINACGRIGRPDLALQLLLAEDAQEADQLARQVEGLNTERQTITDQVIAAAREQAAAQMADGADVLVTRGERWPLGVLGLVAGRLAEEFRRPVFVISQNGIESRGSARGPQEINLGEVLAARAEFFTRFGGHAQAAGFTLPTEALPAFEAYLSEHFTAQAGAALDAQSTDLSEANRVLVDCRLALRRIMPDSDVYRDLEALEPFGAGFPEPVFLCPGARILGCRRSGIGGRTLRLRLAHGATTREFVWSRRGELCDTLRAALPNLPPVDAIFTLRKYHRPGADEPEWQPHIETLTPVAT